MFLFQSRSSTRSVQFLGILVLVALSFSVGCNPASDQSNQLKPGDNQAEPGESGTKLASSNNGDSEPSEVGGEEVLPSQPQAEQQSPAPAEPKESNTEGNAAEPVDFGFARLEPLQSTDPKQLAAYLTTVDAGIRDLTQASSANLINEDQHQTHGIRLGTFKLDAANQLIEATEGDEAAADYYRVGRLNKLVALSHLSGFKSVEAAKQLESYAKDLVESDDLDLAHQGRVVLVGFELQELQNGVLEAPKVLVQNIRGLFNRPEDRNFPAMMTLIQASQVLGSMGFEQAAKQVDEILVGEFSKATDPQLRSEAWNVQTKDSQSIQNYMVAMQGLNGSEQSQSDAVAAARQLYVEFPSLQTLEQIASTITNLEYGGQSILARGLTDFVEKQLNEHDSAELPGLSENISNLLQGSQTRFALIGKTMNLTEEIVSIDGEALTPEALKGKVVLVDFWATWCLPCIKEIPNIRDAYEKLHDEGFEVLSINMDNDLDDARAFVRDRDFPWTTYHAANLEALGFEASFAKRLRVDAIPFMLLIDQEGKVADIHVRGDNIKPAVRKLLGLDTSLMLDE